MLTMQKTGSEDIDSRFRISVYSISAETSKPSLTGRKRIASTTKNGAGCEHPKVQLCWSRQKLYWRHLRLSLSIHMRMGQSRFRYSWQQRLLKHMEEMLVARQILDWIVRTGLVKGVVKKLIGFSCLAGHINNAEVACHLPMRECCCVVRESTISCKTETFHVAAWPTSGRQCVPAVNLPWITTNKSVLHATNNSLLQAFLNRLTGCSASDSHSVLAPIHPVPARTY